MLLVRFGLFRVCVVRARHRRPTLLTRVGAHSAALMALGAARQISRTYSTASGSRTLTQRSGAVATSTGGAALPAAERGREGGGPTDRLRSRLPLGISGLRRFHAQPLNRRELWPSLCGEGPARLPASPGGGGCPCHTMQRQLIEAASAGSALSRFQNPDPPVASANAHLPLTLSPGDGRLAFFVLRRSYGHSGGPACVPQVSPHPALPEAGVHVGLGPAT